MRTAAEFVGTVPREQRCGWWGQCRRRWGAEEAERQEGGRAGGNRAEIVNMCFLSLQVLSRVLIV